MMRCLWRGLRLLLLVTAILVGFVAAWLHLTWPDPAKLPPLRDGDLVFQTIRSHQSTAIMLASRTWYTHVGIVRIGLDGQPQVMEAVGPVRQISLARWIKQGIGERLLVKRLPELSQGQARMALQAAEHYLGKPYDFYFLMGDDAIYCSELVYKAFREGPGLTLGQVQKVGTLHLDNFAVERLLQERWSSDPVCQKPETNNYASCLAAMKREDIITPDSLARDQRLHTPYSNYPF